MSKTKIKIRYQTRRIPGIYLEGVLEPYRKTWLKRKLFDLTIPAGGGGPYYPRCVPASQAAEAQEILTELTAPDKRGRIFVDYSILEELNEQGPFDSQFGMVFTVPDAVVQRALVDNGLAVKETKGGLHRTEALQQFIDQIEWPKSKDKVKPK